MGSYNAFWMNMPEVKRSYRHAEHLLQASEFLATAASVKNAPGYPSELLYHCWVLMLMNMDRNILWGAGAGAPFDDPRHWNAQDRFDFVEKHAGETLAASLRALSGEGRGITLFNPLNWEREDLIEIPAVANQRPAGVVAEAHGEGWLCAVRGNLGDGALGAASGPAHRRDCGVAGQVFRQTVSGR